MSKEAKDLHNLLTQSIDALRASPAEREKYPALDRLLTRIETRQRRSPWRSLLAPLSSAAAGFAGAALAVMLLPSWFADAPRSSTPPEIAVAAAHVQSADSARALARSIHRLERAIHGLENFQPLVESRIEALEDAFQRKYADAYASGEDVSRSKDPYQAVQMRQDRGAFF
jgi:hypothetical protein